MILVTGGTGTVGRRVVTRLLADGQRVRVLTRDAARGGAPAGAEVCVGDVRDAASLARAMVGVDAVVSAFHGFNDPLPDGHGAVDRAGNSALVAAAVKARARRFVMVSIAGAAPHGAIELQRAKWAAEEAVRGSGLEWTIVRFTALTETWAGVVEAPLATSDTTLLFGRCQNPINFVAADDVAAVVAASAAGAHTGETVELGGPQNLTFREFVEVYAAAVGRPVRLRRIPRPVMRVTGVVLRRVNVVLARHARAGVVMDTTDMTRPPSPLAPTTVHEALRRRATIPALSTKSA